MGVPKTLYRLRFGRTIKRRRFQWSIGIAQRLGKLYRPLRNKKHGVFELSFDWKECNDERLVEQYLNYIHENASKGEDRLVVNPTDYDHSSAAFYILG